MRGISILHRSTRTLLASATLLAPGLLAGLAHAQATPQAAPTQPIVSAVPTPTLPTLNSAPPTPTIKPAAPTASTLVPLPQASTPAVTVPRAVPQAPPARTAPIRRAAEQPAAQPRLPVIAPAPAPTAEPTPTPTAQPEPTPAPSPTPEPAPASETAVPEASATAAPLAPAASDGATPWWPWAAGLGALAMVIAAFALRRRRAAEVAPEQTIAPAASAPRPTAAPAPAPVPPAPAPGPAPIPPAPPPSPPQPPRGLEVALHADRLSATLVNATLSCRLVLTNRASHALTDLAVSGDMTSAHASRPMDEQLGLAGPELPPLRMIERLEAGQSVTVPAEMRLPLSTILTIRAGAAQLFVPIVRASVWATREGDGAGEHAHGAFLVGQPATAGDPAARLQPFRLDQGPRVFDVLDQRPMPLPAI